MVVPRGWGEERGSCCFMGTELQLCKRKRVVWMGDADGCPAI